MNQSHPLLIKKYIDFFYIWDIFYPLIYILGLHMTRKTPSKEGLPFSLRKKIMTVGHNIRLARKRRGLTMQDMAKRMFVTRKTLNRLESGDPGVSMSILAAALMTLGLESDLEKLANPEMDNTGNIIDREKYAQKQRVRQQKKIDIDF